MAEPDLRLLAFNMLRANMQNGPAMADYLLLSDADLVLLNETRRAIPAAFEARYPFQMRCGGRGEGDVIML